MNQKEVKQWTAPPEVRSVTSPPHVKIQTNVPVLIAGDCPLCAYADGLICLCICCRPLGRLFCCHIVFSLGNPKKERNDSSEIEE
ncbi:MAG: hypothetical protein AAGU02_06780, partial [Lawsonibacter sp.]